MVTVTGTSLVKPSTTAPLPSAGDSLLQVRGSSREFKLEFCGPEPCPPCPNLKFKLAVFTILA